VVILAGTNDIAATQAQLESRTSRRILPRCGVGEGQSHRYRVSSVLPVHNYTPNRTTLRPASSGKDCGIESLAKDLLRRQGCIYLDYFSAMVDRSGLLRKELANDGLHPNQAGYKLMAPLAEGAIDKLSMRVSVRLFIHCESQVAVLLQLLH